jgi:hypothetical protein
MAAGYNPTAAAAAALEHSAAVSAYHQDWSSYNQYYANAAGSPTQQGMPAQQSTSTQQQQQQQQLHAQQQHQQQQQQAHQQQSTSASATTTSEATGTSTVTKDNNNMFGNYGSTASSWMQRQAAGATKMEMMGMTAAGMQGWANGMGMGSLPPEYNR